MDKLGIGAFGGGVLVGLGGANVAPLASYTGAIDVDPVSLSSPAGATPNLKSFSVPANALNAYGTGVGGGFGRGLRIRGGGSFANNANAKTVNVQFGGTSLFGTAITATVSTANLWHFDVTVLIRSATTAIASGLGAQGPGTATLTVGDLALTGLVLTAATTIQVVGTQTAAADIVQDYLFVEYLQ